MIQIPMDVLHQFPVRKTGKQKRAFRDAVCAYVQSMGYPVMVESGDRGCHNIVMGDPDTAKYLVTAHYDTPALNPISNMIAPCSRLQKYLRKTRRFFLMLGCSLILTIGECVLLSVVSMLFGDYFTESLIYALILIAPFLLLLQIPLINFLRLRGLQNPTNVNDNTSGIITLLEIMRTLPENQRHKVCFVLFDLEELGLVGSKSYCKSHIQAVEQQFVLNMDCIGDGDLLTMIPTKKLLTDRVKLTSLYRICGYFGKKSLLVCEAANAFYPSDQNSFPYGVGIVALNKHKRFGLYLDKIHTKKDTILEETNVNILRAALISFICCDAVN